MTWVAARAALVALALSTLVPPVALADHGIAPDGFSLVSTDAAGQVETRAGAHPDLLTTSLTFESAGGLVDANVKDIVIELPAGLVGDGRAVQRCAREQFAVGTDSEIRCPPASQVGTVDLTSVSGLQLSAPIYNIEPSEGVVAEYGYRIFFLSGRMFGRMAEDGQALRLEIADQGQDMPMATSKFELWGVPAHRQGEAAGSRRAFLTLPSRCDGGPLRASARFRTWQRQDVWRTVSTTLPTPTECERMRFEPAADLRLETARADTPTGLRVDVALPQDEDPAGQGAARVRSIEMRLPEGVVLSPGGASALEACDDESLGLGSGRRPACPPNARIGTVSLESPALGDPLAGTFYLGRRLGRTEYRVFVVASGPAIAVKTPGTLSLDPENGQITARLDDLPELPAERISMSFDGGPRAPLVTPLGCGTTTATTTITPYGGGAPVRTASAVAVTSDPEGRPCLAVSPFEPGVLAGSSPARAGRAGSFEMTLRRPDGDQPVDRFDVTLPPGLGARLSSAALCPEGAARTAACPAASRVGSVAIEAGAGPAPLVVEGDVFLSGAYRRAPFGLVMRIPAKAGPFDLGTIVARARLRVDPSTGRVSVASDPLPRIVDGVPLRIQTLALTIDRPRFVLNPTSCAAAAVEAVVTATDERTARRDSRFRATRCDALRFAPRLGVDLTDRRELRAGGRPGVVLRIAPGTRGANLRAADIALPRLLEQRSEGITAICSREQARDGRCPRGSRVGSAVARTPLISGPLRGAAYVVQPPGTGRPDVWVRVSGQRVALDLRLRTVVRHGAIVARIVDAPDFPLSSFRLSFAAGERGIFTARRSPCRGGRARRIAVAATMTGQNGAIRRVRPLVRSACRP